MVPMVCPQCGGEFRAEILSCPDCNAALVPVAADEHREDASQGRGREPSHVVLRTADPATLALARGLLTEAGIPFAVHNERMAGLYPSALLGPPLDAKFRAAEVEVLDPDLSEAQSVLAGLDGLVDPDRRN